MVVAETLRSQRLLLRRPVATDTSAVYQYCSDPLVTEWLAWPCCTDKTQFEQDFAAYKGKWNRAEEFYWVITRLHNPRAIGSISCRVAQQAADIGFLFDRRVWGQGLATEAATVVLSELISVPEISRVVAVCAVENHASARVLEKIGMQRKGIIDKLIDCPNRCSAKQDAILFDLECE
ncbi:hypothetical protein AB833_32450 [Chromatiales bacterium (ex Bugula neritina AB1)]|nr:hypothetical protein AB833_32450 [Chromatiales bacterium (ex Bugula neritina AB1)]